MELDKEATMTRHAVGTRERRMPLRVMWSPYERGRVGMFDVVDEYLKEERRK